MLKICVGIFFYIINYSRELIMFYICFLSKYISLNLLLICYKKDTRLLLLPGIKLILFILLLAQVAVSKKIYNHWQNNSQRIYYHFAAYIPLLVWKTIFYTTQNKKVCSNKQIEIIQQIEFLHKTLFEP